MVIGLVFPGQGCQYDKMGMDFLSVSEESIKFCKAVEDHISMSITTLLRDVDKNDNLSQLRIIVAEILIYYAFKSKISESNIEVKFVAGHSLGEYSALYVSGILSLSELLNLVLFRNKVIESNQFSEKTSMIAITNSDITNIIQSISKLNIENLFPSNINSYKQVVYSGSVSAINDLVENVDDDIRSVVLNVNQGYHSPLMKNASVKFRDYILKSNFSVNSINLEGIKVLNNLTGECYSSKEEVLSNLSKQLVSPVDWVKVIEKLSKNVDAIVEIGPGKTLTKFNKNILKNNKIKDVYLGHIEDIETLNFEIREMCYEAD